MFLEDVIVTESGGANPFNDAVIKEPTTGVAKIKIQMRENVYIMSAEGRGIKNAGYY